MNGWMFGTFWWGVDSLASRACAQGFIYNSATPYFLVEVLIWAHSKYADTTASSSLLVTVNAIDSTSSYGTSSTSYNINCPGTVLDSHYIQFANIDTGLSVTFTNAMISPPILINNNFAIVVDVSDFYIHSDTVGFVAGAIGSASNLMGLPYTWWKYHNTTSGKDFWTQLSHVFNNIGSAADRAIAFWPVIDVSTGIDSPDFIDGLKMSQNRPNPAVNITLIDYVLEKKSKNVNLKIYDANGRVVFERNQGSQNSGQYSIEVNTDNLSNGKYYYSLSADGKRLTMSMIITK